MEKTSSLNAEQVDLAQLTRELSRRCDPVPEDYVPGKTVIRDTVRSLLSCSAVEAEELVDTLERLAFVRFEAASADRPSAWRFEPSPRSFR